MIDDPLTSTILKQAYYIHSKLGPGLLESTYQSLLEGLLVKAGLKVQREVVLDVELDGIRIDNAYRVDLLINNQVVIEIKSISQLERIHFKQLLTYLRIGKYPTGLLINFNEEHLKNGIRRIENKYGSIMSTGK